MENGQKKQANTGLKQDKIWTTNPGLNWVVPSLIQPTSGFI